MTENIACSKYKRGGFRSAWVWDVQVKIVKKKKKIIIAFLKFLLIIYYITRVPLQKILYSTFVFVCFNKYYCFLKKKIEMFISH